jgi:hypothetical protein
MTTKDDLLHLVDELDDAAADGLCEGARRLVAAEGTTPRRIVSHIFQPDSRRPEMCGWRPAPAVIHNPCRWRASRHAELRRGDYASLEDLR